MFHRYYDFIHTFLSTRNFTCLIVFCSTIHDPEQAYADFRKKLSLAYFKIFPPNEDAVMLRNMMKDMEKKEEEKVLLPPLLIFMAFMTTHLNVDLIM